MRVAALELAEPRALWALGLALPVVLAHLYRRRRRRFPVAFVPLLRESVGPVLVRAWWNRFAQTARLACRLLALAALVLALAGPRPARAATPETDLVLVLDADPTTRAVEARGPGGEETRFDRAAALARAHVLAHEGGRVGLVLAGPAPRVLAPLAADRRPVLDALAGAACAPKDGRGDLAAAVRVARAAGEAGRPLDVLVVSSRPLEGVPEGTARAVGAGSASDDQGLSEPTLVPAPDGVRTVARWTVRNVAEEPRTRRLRVAWRGAAEAVLDRDVATPAGGTAEVSVEVLPPREGGLLVATLQGDDALASDDLSAAWLAPPPRPSVLVVHAGAPRPFVAAVLDAMGDAVDRERSGFVLASEVERAVPRDVTLVDGAAVPARVVARGAWIFLAPFPAGEGAKGWPFAPGRAVRDPLVWRTAPGSPLLEGVDLSTALVARATTLRGDAVRGLAYAEGEPVVAEGTTGDVRWLAFGLDPDGSDLPLRAALPVLLRNAVRRLGALPAAPLRPCYRAGSPLAPRVPWPEGRALRLRREALAAPTPTRGEREGSSAAAPAAPRRTPPAPAEAEETIPAGAPAPVAPPGGPWWVRLGPEGGAAAATVTLDLEPPLDVRPARPASSPPPPTPPPPADDASWPRRLAVAAALLLVVDLALGVRRRRNLASPSGGP